MFGFGIAEVIIILVLAFIVLGPGNPPQPGRLWGAASEISERLPAVTTLSRSNDSDLGVRYVLRTG